VTHAIADRWGGLDGQRQLKGKPLNTADGLIAATALEHDLTVVTRNVKDFTDLGVRRVQSQRGFSRLKPLPDQTNTLRSHARDRTAVPFARAAYRLCILAAVGDIGRRGPMQNSLLFSFVDLKDPFTPGEIASEPRPGQFLSISWYFPR
jgi:hypothetical protein